MATVKKDKLDEGRRLSRRRMARISFLFMLLAAILIVGSVTLGPEPEKAAKAVSTASVVLVSIFGFFTSLVLGYLGASVFEKKKG